jgi:hypothetical protein
MLKIAVNLATWDRAVRVLVGLLMLIFGASGAAPGIWSPALLIFSSVPLVTAILGWCPFYAIMGLRTNRHPSSGLHPTDNDPPPIL